MVSFPVIPRHTPLIVPLAAVCLALAAFLSIVLDRRADAADSAITAEARAIAATGRDTGRRVLPLYIHVHDDLWLQPAPVYLTTAITMIAPGAESPARIASATIAALDVLLMFVAAATIFSSFWLGGAAAAMLLLTPAHAFAGRLPAGALYPIPFVLGWLLCLWLFLRDPSRSGLLVAAGLCLGCGFYTDPTAVLTMPGYLALTWIALNLGGQRTPRINLLAGAGFVLPLLLHLPWFALYPSSYVDTVGRWGVHPAYIRNPMEGVRAFVNWPSLSTRVGIFWDFFNPVYLFQTVLLLPLAILMPAGLYAAFNSDRERPFNIVLALGLATAPMIAATFNEPRATGRELVLLPFAILVATDGVRFLVARSTLFYRATIIALLTAVPLCFLYAAR